jgi:hypothetical protein
MDGRGPFIFGYLFAFIGCALRIVIIYWQLSISFAMAGWMAGVEREKTRHN